MGEKTFGNKIYLFLLGLCFGTVLFLSTYKLTESPKTWLDEGLITQISRNLAEFGTYATQVSPGQFESAWHISTGCTVICPIALLFNTFGPSLLVARSVMVLYIIALLIACLYVLRQTTDNKGIILTLFLIASFAPLYGHGRNVLGEIPGLFFLVACLYLVGKLERGNRNAFTEIALGLAVGLCLTTKPIFILFLPAILVGIFLLKRRGVQIGWLKLLPSAFLPLIVWALLQFSGEPFSRILLFYANPQDIDMWASLFSNFQRFIFEAQPLYALMLFISWLVTIAIRFKRKQSIGVGETVAFVFATLGMPAYLRTAGYYRYFFLPEFVALLYFIPSWKSVLQGQVSKIRIASGLVVLLIILQLYQTVFHSWMFAAIRSTDSRDATLMMNEETTGKSVYVYNIPEAVSFLPHNNYWQYIPLTKTITIGSSTQSILARGIPDILVVNSSMWREASSSVPWPYVYKRSAGRFAVWVRK